jgi:hypothetical protein
MFNPKFKLDFLFISRGNLNIPGKHIQITMFIEIWRGANELDFDFFMSGHRELILYLDLNLPV